MLPILAKIIKYKKKKIEFSQIIDLLMKWNKEMIEQIE